MRVPVREADLVCPGCGAGGEPDERFCAECGLPLVLAGGLDAAVAEAADADAVSPEVSARRRALRKIAPQLAEGPLVKVAWVRNQAEGEFLQSLLLEQGVPSLLRRSPGFDVPDMLFAGPRDVMVAASGVDVARETLLADQLLPGGDAAGGAAGASAAAGAARPIVRPWPLLAGLLAMLAAGALVIWALSLVVH